MIISRDNRESVMARLSIYFFKLLISSDVWHLLKFIM